MFFSLIEDLRKKKNGCQQLNRNVDSLPHNQLSLISSQIWYQVTEAQHFQKQNKNFSVKN